ncbi:2947_t:CDS:2, partial [Gigaspora rosea]
MDQYYYHSIPESAAGYLYSSKGAQYQAKEIRPLVPSSTLRYEKDLLTKVHDVYFAKEEPLESNRLEFEEEKVNLDLLLKKIAAEYHAVGRKWTLGGKTENRAENNNYDLSKKTERQPKNVPSRPKKFVNDEILVESDQETLVEDEDENNKKKDQTKQPPEGIEADIDEPKNRTSNSIRPRLNPKKRKKKDWLETINNINMTNKIIRKKTLQHLLPYRPNLQIFDPGG